MDTNALAAILVAGATIEAVVQLLKGIWDKDSRSMDITMIVVLVLSLLIAFLGPLDLFTQWWNIGAIVGQIITALLLARAAMFVHDIYNKAKG
ncbi:MAG: hypothetical protein QGD96_09250 [Anaerolineae bacterium]|nr:hypothetical protein [Anaerolineae bacterium]